MRRTLLFALGLWVGGGTVVLAGCADAEAPEADAPGVLRSPDAEGSGSSSFREPRATDGVDAEGPADERTRIVFLGTSLTEGMGLDAPADEAWPARIAERFAAEGTSVEVVNAGLGGETSAGALRRLDWILRQDPHVLIVETGANDGLRGLPTADLEANLDSIVARALEARPDLELVLVGMEAPPNMGPDYAADFRETYRQVAARHGLPFVPFLLDGVAGDTELNQSDGIHPTADGHGIMAEIAWPVLDSVVDVVGARSGSR